MARASTQAFLMATAAAFLLAGCQPGSNPFASKETAPEGSVASATSIRLVDRDVEAPKVFQVSDDALWDGRPSLGGVWVASPDAVDPERVILRNPANGKFVIGALFRRERLNPGPPLQISSDAAAALGILAGSPNKISVTALRREEVPLETPDAARPILADNEAVQTTSLDPVQTASAALDKAAPTPITPTAAPNPTSKPAAAAPKPAAAASGTRTVQIGIFSVEANANRAATTLTKAGIPAKVSKDSAQGKDFWGVTAGPTATSTLPKIKSLGFNDAYFAR
ncbi:SPOR domain-containing protein [Pseudorhodobacter antarcticus]|nr:SPOR domain-containing protein [Pseudorhodobacter antarcticus]